jgi:hypothetical protein
MGAKIITKTDRQMEDRMHAVSGDAERADTLQKARAFKRTWLELAEALTRANDKRSPTREQSLSPLRRAPDDRARAIGSRGVGRETDGQLIRTWRGTCEHARTVAHTGARRRGRPHNGQSTPLHALTPDARGTANVRTVAALRAAAMHRLFILGTRPASRFVIRRKVGRAGATGGQDDEEKGNSAYVSTNMPM